jgi:hypothetical protein
MLRSPPESSAESGPSHAVQSGPSLICGFNPSPPFPEHVGKEQAEDDCYPCNNDQGEEFRRALEDGRIPEQVASEEECADPENPSGYVVEQELPVVLPYTPAQKGAKVLI